MFLETAQVIGRRKKKEREVEDEKQLSYVVGEKVSLVKRKSFNGIFIVICHDRGERTSL